MMRVTIVAGTYQPTHCGVAHYTDRLRISLAKLGIPSVVITTHKAAQVADDAEIIGAVPDWSLAALLPLVRSLHATSTDILHIQHAAGTYGFERAIFLLPLLLRVTGWRKPIVITVHEYGWWEWQPRWFPPRLLETLKQWGQRQGWWDREDGFLLTHSNAIITTNSEAETALRERLPGLNDRIHRLAIAPNIDVAPIDPATARRSLRRVCGWAEGGSAEGGWAEETEIIVFFGFLHPVKGLETLLTAFKQVLITHPHARLLLIGGVESLALAGEQATHYWQKLHALTNELALETTVHFTGYVAADTASHYLSGADIGVLPFHHGVTLKSGSLLALWAHGLPVIATQSDQPDRELDDRLRLVAPRDVHGLAIALTELLDDRSVRDRLSHASHSVVQSLAWDGLAAAHLHIYQSVLH